MSSAPFSLGSHPQKLPQLTWAPKPPKKIHIVRIIKPTKNSDSIITKIYLNIKHNIDILNPNKIYQTILDNEIINGFPNEMCEKYKSKFKEKLNNFNIKEYCSDKPFSNSCNALFHWAPIADELKELDKEIVINSIKNKWMLVVADFEKICPIKYTTLS